MNNPCHWTIKNEGMTEMLVASIRGLFSNSIEIKKKMERIREFCDDKIIGPPIIVVNYDSSTEEGFDLEVAYPVTVTFEAGDISSKYLEPINLYSVEIDGFVGSVFDAIGKELLEDISNACECCRFALHLKWKTR